MTEVKIIKETKINEATVSLRSDRIVRVLFHKNTVLDVELQMLLLNIYLEITGKEKHPFLFEAFEGVKVTREAKENAIRIQDEAPGSAYAVVVSNVAYYLIASFYLKVKKTKMPYRVFWKREEAIEWLKTFANTRNGLT